MNRLTPGSSTPSVFFYALRADEPDSIDADEAGLAISYLLTNEGIPQASSYTSITPANLGAINAAHSAGGLIVVDAATGLHRLDLPSAAAPSSGADGVVLKMSATDTDLVLIEPPIVIDELVSSRNSPGPGSREFTWTTKKSGNPVSSVEAWLTTDSAGTNVVGGTYISDDSGIKRVPGGTGKPMIDDDVVYYGWRDSPTNQFSTNPIQFRYSSANSRFELWDGSSYNEWDGVSNDASLATVSSSSTSIVTTAGAMILASKSRGITKDLTILKADGTTIIPQTNDKIRVIIGREGRAAKLTVSSDAATAAGSSFTKGGGGGAKNRLRLDASDLNFAVGAYTMWFEMFDAEDTNEWKLVTKHIFVLEE